MRSVCGGHGGRRRQAHEQEPVACGALGRRGVLSARQRLGTVCLPNAQGGSAGGQRLWRGGDACLPHEPGADRLRCVSFAAGAGADGGRLTSRSLPPAARWATLPCPGGARGAAGVRIRRCLPLRGKGAAEYGAPDHGFIAGESCLRGGLPLNGGRAARPGDGSMPSCAPWDRRVHEAIPQGERRALPAPAQGSRPLRIPF